GGNRLPARAASRERIGGDLSQGPLAHERVERDRPPIFFGVILIDRAGEYPEILFYHGPPRGRHPFWVLREAHRRQNGDESEDDQQFDQREAVCAAAPTWSPHEPPR